MNQYLMAEENREAIQSHNENLVITTIKTVGRASMTSHDFNRVEEHKQLDVILAGTEAERLTVRGVAERLYGDDDDALSGRVRSMLRYGAPYQKTLTNGRAVIARQDGTLRVTGTVEEYGDLVEENTAREVARLNKTVRQGAVRLNKNLAAAADKVPELRERFEETRGVIKTSLGSVFTRHLELLSGDD